MPFSCAAARPRAICCAYSTALREGEGTVAQAVAEGLTLQQFGDDVGRTTVVANVVDRKNVRVVESSGGAGFLREALQAFRVHREGRGKNLDGDIPIEAGVAGPVDFAHPACAQGRLNFIGAEFCASAEHVE